MVPLLRLLRLLSWLVGLAQACGVSCVSVRLPIGFSAAFYSFLWVDKTDLFRRSMLGQCRYGLTFDVW